MANSLQKENDKLNEKLKTTKDENKSLEMKLFKCQEDLECVRQNFQTLKQTARNTENELHREMKCYENQMKISKKQKDDLISAYKKQLLLIDNLKRQNACLEHTNLLHQNKDEFKTCLDWNRNKK